MPKKPGKLNNSDDPLTRMKRNVKINGKRTTINIENYLWENLERISREEAESIDEICDLIDKRKGKHSLPAMIRFVTHEVAREKYAHLYRRENKSKDEFDEPLEKYGDDNDGHAGKSAFMRVLGRLKITRK